jgi:3-hydroxyacyl-CoA dehydrogenase
MTDLNALAADAYLAKAEQDCWVIPDIAADTSILAVAKVGIIGAGTMGGGIAMNFVNAGMAVTIVETKAEALDRGLGVVRRNYENSAKRGRFPVEEVEVRMARLTGALSLEALSDCDLIIEAVFEDMGLKKQIFSELDRIAKPGAILATNTSYLDVDEIASATARPEAVVGMHFFSPANVMALCEVVRGEKTSKEVVATAMAVAGKIGKIGAVVGVGPGFVGNRMLFPRQDQANLLILEGAMPWDVDRVLREFGFRMGPFAMSDLSGLDIGWNAERSKGESLRDVLCEMDRRGQKTGAGYYDYDAERIPHPAPAVEKIIADFAAKKGLAQRKISDDEILARLIYPMINEGARILEEGKAIRASDIDVVWVHGFRWPTDKGGPMFYADRVGLMKVVETLRGFEAQLGPVMKPAELLERLAMEGKGFGNL